MITTSVCCSPDRIGNSRAGSAVAAHSELADGSALQSRVMPPLMPYAAGPMAASASAFKVGKWKSGLVSVSTAGVPPKLLGEIAIDMEHHLARTLVVFVATALVGFEDLVVAELGR